uniref:BTB domain-containing protein n=1 Tax=Leersia perrieri TaxID=77586 RepID=A0A0D9W535_9ORYZ
MSTTTGNRKPVRSASAIIASTESGQHLLKIDGYSRIKDELPTGNGIKSRSFQVGGHSWLIRCYPNGSHSEDSDSISIYLWLKHNVTQGVKAHFMFSILDRARRQAHTGERLKYSFGETGGYGHRSFIERDALEKLGCLWDDCLTIMCDLTVFKELQTEDIDVTTATPPPLPPPPPPMVVVPPSDLRQHLGGLLATGEGSDVTFEVDGKTFAAHRWVLAARSPVFRAKLFGPDKGRATTGSATDVIRIDNMEAQDFVALLCYMYTDCLPERKGGEAVAMLPDLIAAANRYKMERLRLVCEQKLCEYVSGRTVVAMLAFAEEHHCNGLKEMCLRILDDPIKLREIVKAYGLENMIKDYPSILKDLIVRLAAAPGHQLRLHHITANKGGEATVGEVSGEQINGVREPLDLHWHL